MTFAVCTRVRWRSRRPDRDPAPAARDRATKALGHRVVVVLAGVDQELSRGRAALRSASHERRDLHVVRARADDVENGLHGRTSTGITDYHPPRTI